MTHFERQAHRGQQGKSLAIRRALMGDGLASDADFGYYQVAAVVKWRTDCVGLSSDGGGGNQVATDQTTH